MAANRAAEAELEALLTRDRRLFWRGAGKNPAGEWPGEPSVLVLGLSGAEAVALGGRLRQNAIVWIGSGAVAELALLG